MQFELTDRQQIDLFLYALRYAMGRRSAAPSDVANAIKEHWPNLCQQAKTFIRRDLSEEIERDDRCRETGSKILGDDCDRQTWDSLLQFIEQENNAT